VKEATCVVSSAVRISLERLRTCVVDSEDSCVVVKAWILARIGKASKLS